MNTGIKKYYSLGELLKDYRETHKLSQADFAIKLNADIRTIQRWEKDETNINEEKVADLVEATLLPFQLVRNLNAKETIPTFFDFHSQKYSLSKLALEIPGGEWFKRRMNEKTSRIRTIDVDYDFDYLMTYMNIPKNLHKNLYKVIREVSLICPEMSVIITDELGYYSGYCIVFPVNEETYQSIRNRELEIQEIEVSGIVDYKFQKRPIFINCNLNADCNENIQYLVGNVLNFFKNLNSDNYLYCRYDNRDDADFYSKQIGLKQLWSVEANKNNETSMHFFEGNFDYFLKD